MTTSKLTKAEEIILKMVYEVCPQWANILSEQIQHSVLYRIKYESHYSVLFCNINGTEKVNLKTKMPVEIIIGDVYVPKDKIIKDIRGYFAILPCVLSNVSYNSFGIRLYFDDGLISELEIYSLSGSKIDLSLLFDDNALRTYILFEEGLV